MNIRVVFHSHERGLVYYGWEMSGLANSRMRFWPWQTLTKLAIL